MRLGTRSLQHRLEVGEALLDLGFESFEIGDDVKRVAVFDLVVDDLLVAV